MIDDQSSLRTPRAAAIAGILFALLLAAALALVQAAAPRDAGATGVWLTDPTSRRLVALALHLVPFAGIAFLWFIGVVRCERRGHDSSLPQVARGEPGMCRAGRRRPHVRAPLQHG